MNRKKPATHPSGAVIEADEKLSAHVRILKLLDHRCSGQLRNRTSREDLPDQSCSVRGTTELQHALVICESNATTWSAGLPFASSAAAIAVPSAAAGMLHYYRWTLSLSAFRFLCGFLHMDRCCGHGDRF